MRGPWTRSRAGPALCPPALDQIALASRSCGLANLRPCCHLRDGNGRDPFSALSLAARGLLPQGRNPSACLYLSPVSPPLLIVHRTGRVILIAWAAGRPGKRPPLLTAVQRRPSPSIHTTLAPLAMSSAPKPRPRKDALLPPPRTPSPAGSAEAYPLLQPRHPSPRETSPRPSTLGEKALHCVSVAHRSLEYRIGPDSAYRLLERDGTLSWGLLFFAPGMLVGGVALAWFVLWYIGLLTSLLGTIASSISFRKSLLQASAALVVFLCLVICLALLGKIVLGLLHFITGCLVTLLRRMLPHSEGGAAGPTHAALLPL